jgi:hypothetical protein
VINHRGANVLLMTALYFFLEGGDNATAKVARGFESHPIRLGFTGKAWGASLRGSPDHRSEYR